MKLHQIICFCIALSPFFGRSENIDSIFITTNEEDSVWVQVNGFNVIGGATIISEKVDWEDTITQSSNGSYPTHKTEKKSTKQKVESKIKIEYESEINQFYNHSLPIAFILKHYQQRGFIVDHSYSKSKGVLSAKSNFYTVNPFVASDNSEFLLLFYIKNIHLLQLPIRPPPSSFVV